MIIRQTFSYIFCLFLFLIGKVEAQNSNLPSFPFDKALAKIDTTDPSFGLTSHKLALEYMSEGYFSLSKEAFLASMNYYLETDSIDTEELTFLMADFGQLYWNKGELTIAHDLYKEAEHTFSEIDETIQSERYLDLKLNLGIADAMLGNHLSAMVGFNQARTLFEREYQEQKVRIVSTIMRIADVYSEIENLQRAESLYNEAEDQLSTLDIDNSELRIHLLQKKSLFQKKNGNLNEAILLQKDAIDLILKTYEKKSVEYALTLADLGALYLENQQLDLAETTIAEALAIEELEIGTYHKNFLETLRLLGDLYRKENRLMESSQTYIKAISEWVRQYSLLSPVMGIQEKTGYFRTISHLMDKLASIAETEPGEDNSILSTFLDFELIINDVKMHPPLELDLSNSDFIAWRNQSERLLFLYKQPLSSIKGGISVQKKIEEEILEIEKKLAKKSEIKIKRGHENISSWKDLQQSLPDSTVAVEVVRYPWFESDDINKPSNEIHYLFIIFDKNSKKPQGIIIKNGNDLENRYLTHYRNSVNHKFPDDYAYEMYWIPLKDHFKNYDNIIISPSGAYSQINLLTLKNLESGQYLLDEKSIDIVTSIVHQGLQSSTKKENRNEVYIFGNPDYNLERTEPLNDINPYKIYTSSQGESGMHYMRSKIKQQILWNELLYIDNLKSQESGLLDDLYKSDGFTTFIYTNELSSESTLKNLANPYTLHISNHGYFMEDDDLNANTYLENQLLHSGLIFSGSFDYLDNNYYSLTEDDGLLTTYEIAKLNLNKTELVFLSSCETGLGIVKNGNAISNFQHAFQEAGARSLVMTLWTTEAEYQLEFMNLFYYHWLFENLPKKQAFVKSMKIMRNSYDNPYYWGSFIFVGE